MGVLGYLIFSWQINNWQKKNYVDGSELAGKNEKGPFKVFSEKILDIQNTSKWKKANPNTSTYVD